MNKLTIIENKSEVGAGTRGSSMGIDAMKVAALNSNSNYFFKYKTSVITNQNEVLLQECKYPKAKRIEEVIKVYDLLSNEVKSLLEKNHFPIILSGDHSSAGGTITGLKTTYPEKRLGVIWIDAHADLHSPFTSPSGNIHGMSLATALNSNNEEYRIHEVESVTRDLWDKLKNSGNIAPKINARDIVYVGLRDTEEPEDYYISKNNIKSIFVEEVRRNGVAKISQEILSYLDKCDMIYVSFDVDSLDCDLVSYGTGTPVPHGLTEQEAGGLINHLLIDKRTNSFEIVEINPCLDNKQNKMAETTFRILESATSIIEKRGN